MIKVMIDNVRFNRKPEGVDIVPNLIKRLGADKSITTISPEQLAIRLADGYTFKPAICGRKEESWKCQEVFCIDVDEAMTIKDGIDKCNSLGLKPSFIYTTFSHTEKDHRYRIVFIADRVITDIDEARRIQVSLVNLFKSDVKCKNLNRVYYGGLDIVYKDYKANIDVDVFIEKYEEYADVEPVKSANNKRGVLGVPNKDNIYNINSIRYPLNPKTQNDDTNYNIQALKEQNLEYLKTVINRPSEPIIFETNQQFFDYIYKIDLAELLGINYYRSFKCIFHDDGSPSASIFQDVETGNYIYKCNSNKCGVAYNIVGVIEVLGGFKSRPRAYKFIRDLFNLEIMETDWQREQRELLLNNLQAISMTEFNENCGQAQKNTRHIMKYLQHLHYIALDNIYDEKFTDEEGNVSFFASRSHIANQMGISQNSLNKVSQRLVVLTYHKLINKLEDSEINEELLKKSKHMNMKNGNDGYKRVTYFSIPSYTYNLYKEIEEQAKKWKQNGYTVKGTSREMFYRTEGLEVANWLYPQYEKVTKTVNGEKKVVDRTTSDISDLKTNEIVETIFYLIDRKGYATQKEIIHILRSKHGKENIERQIKKSLPDILNTYGLEKKRANKQLKALYKMDMEGYPAIIIKTT